MPEKTGYEPGALSWAELASPHLDEARAFYSALFGWDVDVSPDPATGGYTFFLQRGLRVAGLAPLFGEGQRPAWSTYVSVQDADDTVRAAVKAGATVILEPDDVPGMGRTAILSSPQGAQLSLWQPGAHVGAQVRDEPGAMCWNELTTHDLDTARAFYGAVFGWEPRTDRFGATSYTTWTLDGRSVAGLVLMDRDWPSEVPADWMVYFSVDDCDEAAARADDLGGSVSVPPAEMPGSGRFAVVNDPHGAVFAVTTMAVRHT